MLQVQTIPLCPEVLVEISVLFAKRIDDLSDFWRVRYGGGGRELREKKVGRAGPSLERTSLSLFSLFPVQVLRRVINWYRYDP